VRTGRNPTLSNIQFSQSSYYIHDSCSVSILPHTNVSSGVMRSTGSSRAKRCRLLHRNTRTSRKNPLLFRTHNRNLCSHFTDRNLTLRIRRFYSVQCAMYVLQKASIVSTAVRIISLHIHHINTAYSNRHKC